MGAKLPPLMLTVDQDDLDDSEDDGIRREKALLVLSSLAIDALDELSGLSKVCRYCCSMECGRWNVCVAGCEPVLPSA